MGWNHTKLRKAENHQLGWEPVNKTHMGGEKKKGKADDLGHRSHKNYRFPFWRRMSSISVSEQRWWWCPMTAQVWKERPGHLLSHCSWNFLEAFLLTFCAFVPSSQKWDSTTVVPILQRGCRDWVRWESLSEWVLSKCQSYQGCHRGRTSVIYWTEAHDERLSRHKVWRARCPNKVTISLFSKKKKIFNI